MSSDDTTKPKPNRGRDAMRQQMAALLKEGELHRATVMSIEAAGGYQPPAEAPQPLSFHSTLPDGAEEPSEERAKAPLPPALRPLLEEDEEEPEPPALLFQLPTKRRRGKISDDNYRSTSLRVHRQLWKWAGEIKLNEGWDLSDLVNLGLARLKDEWDNIEK